MNILISSAGRRVSLVNAFKTELKKKFPKAKVIASDSAPSLSSACQVADDCFKVPKVDDKDYFNVLVKKCVEYKIALIIPTIDTELAILSGGRSLLISKKIYPVVSDLAFIKKCRDKRLTHHFFNSHNIRTAKEYNSDNFKLPMFLKPWDGSRSIDTFLIRTIDDLKEYHLNNKKLMFLEYLDHGIYDEYTCDLYYNRGHDLKCIVPRKRLQVRDGEVSKGLTVRNILIEYIKKHLSHVDGAIGCLTLQHNYPKVCFSKEPENPVF